MADDFIKFIIGVGAQKAGTTLLYELLSQADEIDGTTGEEFQAKELHYFDREKNPNYDDYLSQFAGRAEYKLDVTPDYMFYPNSVEKICEILPVENVKIIAILRDPVKRAESHFYMSRRRGIEKKSFEEAFEYEHNRMKESDLLFRETSYFERGKYYKQVLKLYACFPKENIKIIIFQDFIKQQQKTMDDICDFLGIGKIKVSASHSHKGYDVRFKSLPKILKFVGPKIEKLLPRTLFLNVRNFYRKMNRTDINKEEVCTTFYYTLRKYFEPDIIKLEKLIGKDLSTWYTIEQ